MKTHAVVRLTYPKASFGQLRYRRMTEHVGRIAAHIGEDILAGEPCRFRILMLERTR